MRQIEMCMCMRTKQVRTGIYKTLSKGFIRVEGKDYHVPVGTMIVPEKNEVIVKMKWGRICWQYDAYRNCWMGRLLSDDFTIKKSNEYIGSMTDNAYDTYNELVLKTEDNGTAWVMQIANCRSSNLYPKRKMLNMLKTMVA